jgi:hypothetical protein
VPCRRVSFPRTAQSRQDRGRTGPPTVHIEPAVFASYVLQCSSPSAYLVPFIHSFRSTLILISTNVPSGANASCIPSNLKGGSL